MTESEAAARPMAGLGDRLRAAREQSDRGVRDLARSIGVSPSLISQIEGNKVQPSVRTLYEIVTELGISFDELLTGDRVSRWIDVTSDEWQHTEPSEGRQETRSIVQRAGERRGIHFAKGVRWESLIPTSQPGVEFLLVEYQPGAESSPANFAQRHTGREWGYVLSGRLSISLESEIYTLEAGDSIAFPSTIPHRFWNPGSETARGVWFVLENKAK